MVTPPPHTHTQKQANLNLANLSTVVLDLLMAARVIQQYKIQCNWRQYGVARRLSTVYTVPLIFYGLVKA